MSKVRTTRQRVTTTPARSLTGAQYRAQLAPGSMTVPMDGRGALTLDAHTGVNVGATAWLPVAEGAPARWWALDVTEAAPEVPGAFTNAPALFSIALAHASGTHPDDSDHSTALTARASVADLVALVSVVESVRDRLRAAGVLV